MAIDALNSGLSGMQKGLDGLRRDAHTIARQTLPAKADGNTAPTRDRLPQALVGLRQDQTQVTASARLVRAAGETLGTLLDLRA